VYVIIDSIHNVIISRQLQTAKLMSYSMIIDRDEHSLRYDYNGWNGMRQDELAV
jgi:hypothetical protein